MYIPVVDGRVSACASTHRDTCDGDKETTAAPGVGPIRAYMQVRWRETRSCRALKPHFSSSIALEAWPDCQLGRATCLVRPCDELQGRGLVLSEPRSGSSPASLSNA